LRDSQRLDLAPVDASGGVDFYGYTRAGRESFLINARESHSDKFNSESDPMKKLKSVIPPVAERAFDQLGKKRFATILADPPWRFQNSTGKVAPEHKRLSRYSTMTLDDICSLPVSSITEETAHLYLWVPNALLPDGLRVMKEWGFPG
jgi:hypothetical protein